MSIPFSIATAESGAKTNAPRAGELAQICHYLYGNERGEGLQKSIQ